MTATIHTLPAPSLPRFWFKDGTVFERSDLGIEALLPHEIADRSRMMEQCEAEMRAIKYDTMADIYAGWRREINEAGLQVAAGVRA